MTNEAALRVRIDRNRWLRGAPDATLRNPDTGHECVVGTIARTAGIPVDQLDNRGRIAEIGSHPIPAVLHEFDRNRNDTSWTADPRAPERRFPTWALLHRINDDPLLGDATRERMLTEVAAGIGIALTFTGTALAPHAIPPTTDGRARQAAISRGECSGRPARRLRFKMNILTSKGAWAPLDAATLTLDTDPEAIWAYAYDLLRSHAYEHGTAVRITIRDTATSRTIADAYHEPVR